MINTEGEITTISCDKCGRTSIASIGNYNMVFWDEGWSLNSSAKKYVHKCNSCLSKRSREAIKFVKQKFG